LIRFAFPVLVAMFLQTMYGAVDLLIVGQFASTADVSAVATGGQLMQFLNVMAIGISMGTTILLGQHIGAGKGGESNAIIGTGITIFAILSVVITVVTMAFANLFASWMNAPAQAFALTASYIRICGGGALFIVAYNAIGSIFRGMGDSRTPLIAVAIACVANIAGDLLLVARFGMGTRGAALATIFSQGLSVAICLPLIGNGKQGTKFKPKDLRIQPALAKKTLAYGLPLALQDGLVSISFLAIIAIMNSLGLIASAGVGVSEKLAGFIMLVPSSFGQSLSAFVAQNIGAGKFYRAKRSMRYCMGIAFAIALFISYATYFHGDLLCRIFSKESEVVAAGWEYMKGYSIDVLRTSFLFCFIGFFNGCGKTRFVMAQGIVGAFGIRVPVSYLMSRIAPDSLFRIALATPISSVVQILLCIVYFSMLQKQERQGTRRA
jgi:putative MATE family efflux protein